jgi:hypothetical protein
MTKLKRKYEEYKRIEERYLKFREEVMEEPRKKLKKFTSDLKLDAAETEFHDLLQRKKKQAWSIYKKLYLKQMRPSDVEKFISIADEIMEYPDFLSDKERQVWEVSRDLVRAYDEAFVGTEDEYNQKSILKHDKGNKRDR